MQNASFASTLSNGQPASVPTVRYTAQELAERIAQLKERYDRETCPARRAAIRTEAFALNNRLEA